MKETVNFQFRRLSPVKALKPLTDKTTEEMQRAYLKLLGRLKKAGLKPKKHVMDNEVSEEMKEVIEK